MLADGVQAPIVAEIETEAAEEVTSKDVDEDRLIRDAWDDAVVLEKGRLE